jgi:hypothetical protein
MARKTPDDFRKQINEVWKQAINQLEDVKDVVLKSGDRMEAEVERLRLERDKLLKKLGEQTHKLANQGKLPMPGVVKQTVDRLNEVIDKMVKSRKKKTKKRKTSKKKKKTTKKKAKKKVTKKKTTKKTKRAAK